MHTYVFTCLCTYEYSEGKINHLNAQRNNKLRKGTIAIQICSKTCLLYAKHKAPAIQAKRPYKTPSIIVHCH